uniref:Uncharacterized protein n=1 Tax=Anguilla anguilla TaxID=7936 RepID=A0A0E9RS25_ANGAN
MTEWFSTTELGYDSTERGV